MAESECEEVVVIYRQTQEISRATNRRDGAGQESGKDKKRKEKGEDKVRRDEELNIVGLGLLTGELSRSGSGRRGEPEAQVTDSEVVRRGCGGMGWSDLQWSPFSFSLPPGGVAVQASNWAARLPPLQTHPGFCF